MSQPVKLSDRLILDARLASELAERSIAGQVEFWANLGRALEPLISGAQALALRRAGEVKPLSACLEEVDSPAGRRRAVRWLEAPIDHAAEAGSYMGPVFAIASRTAPELDPDPRILLISDAA